MMSLTKMGQTRIRASWGMTAGWGVGRIKITSYPEATTVLFLYKRMEGALNHEDYVFPILNSFK